jgi:uncharacterized protein with HEPN domain
MPFDQGRQALLDIRDNILLAQGFLGDLEESGLTEDRKTFYAVIRCLEIISEASRRIPSEVKQRHPGQPWANIASAGNIYRHRYDNVAEAFVWRTVSESLPSLLAVIESELSQDRS